MASCVSTELSPDLLTCKICQLPFNEPKRLPCLHTFCRACLVYQLKVNAVSATNDGMICLFCPLCKQLCELNGRSGVDGLPDHHLLKTLVDAIQSRAPRPCDHCNSLTTDETGNRARSARPDRKSTNVGHLSTHCCVRCEEFLCDDCASQHKVRKTSADHLVVSVGAMKQLCQVIAVQQLQKPPIVATLINTFDNNSASSSCLEDHTRRLTAGARSRPFDAKPVTAPSARAFANPVGIALNKSDELVVTNSGDQSISLIDLSGRCQRRIDQTVYQLHGDDVVRHFTNTGVGCCAVTAEGYIAVAMSTQGADEIVNHGSTTNCSSRVSASATKPHPAAVIQSLAGRKVASCDIIGTEKSFTNCQPHGIAVTEDGHVIISDVGCHSIYVFDADYRFVCKFGRRGSRNTQFKSPRYLTITPGNDIIVSDYGNHSVKVFSLNGDFRFKFGGVGHDPGRLLHPAGVCTDRHGNIFVADRDNERVQMFNSRGRHVGIVVSDTGTAVSGSARRDVRPLDVAVTSQTHLVVLLTGIEGIDWVAVQVYQVRCTLPPAEVRSIEQILATIRLLNNGCTPTNSGVLQSKDKKRHKVKFALPDIAKAGSEEKWSVNAGQQSDVPKSQVCVIS